MHKLPVGKPGLRLCQRLSASTGASRRCACLRIATTIGQMVAHCAVILAHLSALMANPHDDLKIRRWQNPASY
jgi:hypothetical protein